MDIIKSYGKKVSKAITKGGTKKGNMIMYTEETSGLLKDEVKLDFTCFNFKKLNGGVAFSFFGVGKFIPKMNV